MGNSVIEYFKRSVKRFKDDWLSKAIYDIFKYLIITFAIAYILKFVSFFKPIFAYKVTLTIWLIIALVILTIFVVLISLGVKFHIILRKIKEANQIDELTGLKNYKALNEVLINIFEQDIYKENFPISLILFDVDNFKKFNSKYSYDIADVMLAKLGELLNKDSRITDKVYRYYMRGDEFLLVAFKTNLSDAQQAGNRKRKLIEDTNFVIGEDIYKLTVCNSVTEITNKDNKESVLKRLHLGLQNAKKNPCKNKTEVIA